jgi:hypothetical protein
MINVTAIDTIPPSYFDFSGNDTSIITGGSFKLSANWTDNYRLLGYWITSMNYESGDFSNGSAYPFSTNQSSKNFTGGAAGVYQFKIYANDSLNNWNVTGLWNLTVGTDTPPQWYGYGTNTTDPFLLGSSDLIYSNWTDDLGISVCIFQEIFQNGTLIGNSSQTLTCSVPNTDCVCSVAGIAEPYGVHVFKWFVNDTGNNWNSTPSYNLTVRPPQNYVPNATWWQINPCYYPQPTIWQVGTNFSFQIRYNDTEGDNSTIIAYFYDADGNYSWQIGVGQTGVSGTLWNYTSPYLTNTTSNLTFRIAIQNTPTYVIPYVNDTIEYLYFTNIEIRQSGGYIYGECTSDIDDTPTAATPGKPDEALTTLFNNLLGNLSIPLMMLWLIILVIIIAVIWYYFHNEALLAGIATFGVSILWLLLGFKLSVISPALFGVLIAFIIAVAGFVVWKVMKNG